MWFFFLYTEETGRDKVLIKNKKGNKLINTIKEVQNDIKGGIMLIP